MFRLPPLKKLLGRQGKDLPAPVRAAVARQDASSEILIRCVQLAVVVVFGLFYVLSPKTDATTAFSPVPYVVSAYLFLAVLGLALVWLVRMPDWAIVVTIVFDIGLLMALIWSFHIQYEQPASFSLKSPTFLYVFIFIALRALRFRSRFVLAAGLSAVAFWLAMLAYVAWFDEMGRAVTRDYVRYLTSNTVLIGAEVDKILSVLTVTGILALALRRARGLLVQAVSESVAARNLSRFFDQDVAETIRRAAHEDRLAGVRREAAVLFIDIRGFTPFAAGLPPSEVIAVLTEYQRRIVPHIRAQGGAIDKFLGDGIMATFGAVTESATYAADALRAVDSAVADAASWNRGIGPLAALGPRPIGAAVAIGPVVFGTLGDSTHLEATVIGSPVNLAAKLEKHNKALGCRALTTREALETAIRHGYQPRTAPEMVSARVEGAHQPQDLALLYR